MKDSTLLKLDYLSILEINGKGSFDLLQGQITADVNKVSDNNCVVGACLLYTSPSPRDSV